MVVIGISRVVVELRCPFSEAAPFSATASLKVLYRPDDLPALSLEEASVARFLEEHRQIRVAEP
jgi:hypothetical protein